MAAVPEEQREDLVRREGADPDEVGDTRLGVDVIEGGPSCRIDFGGEGFAYRVLGEVEVGLDPEGVVVRRSTGMIYVACSRSNWVAVVDPGSFEVVRTIPVGGEPIDIAIDDRTGRIFTADARGSQVTAIDADTYDVLATIPVGDYPSGLCIDVQGRRLYSGDAAGSTMSVIDIDRLERIGVVDAELGAGAIDADVANGRVYCVNFVASSLTVVDASTLGVVGRVPLLAGPCAVAVHPATGDVFVVDSLASSVTRIDGRRAEKIAEMHVPNAPVGLAMGSRGDRLYVGNRGDGTVSVLGLDGVEWARIPVGTAPGGVCEDPLNPRRVYAANAGSGSLTIIDDLLDGPPATRVEDRTHPMVGQKMPELRLPDLWTEELRDLGEWAGRKYVINVFASW